MSGALQLGVSDDEQVDAKKKTRRQIFLDAMDATIPWDDCSALIRPGYHQPSTKGGRSPFPLDLMLRIHWLQQWITLLDPRMEEMLIAPPVSAALRGSTRSLNGFQMRPRFRSIQGNGCAMLKPTNTEVLWTTLHLRRLQERADCRPLLHTIHGRVLNRSTSFGIRKPITWTRGPSAIPQLMV